MRSNMSSSATRSLAILHPVFLLTGILHAVGGPLLPSIASTFGFSDSQSGLLFLAYFAGTSLGALLCAGNYPRLMATGFALVVLSCGAIIVASWPALLLAFAAMGVGVGLPMSAVSLFVGRKFGDKSAGVLVLLNFTWSAGAMVAPLMASRVLFHHGFRTAYAWLAALSAVAALVSLLCLHDAPEAPIQSEESGAPSPLRGVLLFAVAAFIEVGIENTAAAWLSTYILRSTHSGPALAASLSALYWIGFLIFRAGSSLILVRVAASHLLRVVVPVALCAAAFLVLAPFQSASKAAMLILGAACAPIYPLIVAGSFSHVRAISQSRWVLAAAGIGGSVLPWLTGSISAHSGSIRSGVLTLPAALLCMLLLLPLLSQPSQRAEHSRAR
jgi:MFS transporter, FHS family, glucose/mannose:H+ symporter